MTKTLTQLSNEELEAFRERFGNGFISLISSRLGSTNVYGEKELGDWLLAHDRRIIEAAFAATEGRKKKTMSEEMMDGIEPIFSDEKLEKDLQNIGFNAALSEVNNLKQEFLK